MEEHHGDGDPHGQDHFGTAGSNHHREPGPQYGGDLRAQDGSGLTTAAGELLGPDDGGLVGLVAFVATAGGDIPVRDPAALLAAGAGDLHVLSAAGLVGSVRRSGRQSRHDPGSSSHGGARQLGPEEYGEPAHTASPAAPFPPPARERNPVIRPVPVVRARRAVRRDRARGAAPTRPPAALLAMLLGAMVIVGEPDAPWPCQFGAFLIWLTGCFLLFLPRRL